MEEQFVPYELAVKLKELEFDEPVFAYYKTDELKIIEPFEVLKNSEFHDWVYGAPLWQQAFHFFREKYKLIIMINPFFQGIKENNFLSFGYAVHNIFVGKCDFNTYEEARLACLKELIKIVETWNTQKK